MKPKLKGNVTYRNVNFCGENVGLFMIIADIRKALGVGSKPMLSDLAGICAKMKKENDAFKAKRGKK